MLKAWSLAKFYPWVPPTLVFFFADFYRDMLGHGINIYNLCYYMVVLKKKLIKLLKIALLGHYLGKTWANMGHTQYKAQFFSGHNKRRWQAFKNLFYEISFDWVMNDFLTLWYFAAKTSQFWAETVVWRT